MFNKTASLQKPQHFTVPKTFSRRPKNSNTVPVKPGHLVTLTIELEASQIIYKLVVETGQAEVTLSMDRCNLSLERMKLRSVKIKGIQLA